MCICIIYISPFSLFPQLLKLTLVCLSYLYGEIAAAAFAFFLRNCSSIDQKNWKCLLFSLTLLGTRLRPCSKWVVNSTSFIHFVLFVRVIIIVVVMKYRGPLLHFALLLPVRPLHPGTKSGFHIERVAGAAWLRSNFRNKRQKRTNDRFACARVLTIYNLNGDYFNPLLAVSVVPVKNGSAYKIS